MNAPAHRAPEPVHRTILVPLDGSAVAARAIPVAARLSATLDAPLRVVGWSSTGTLDDLLKPENKEKLKGILLYHVVSGKVMSTDLKGTVKPATLQGATLTIIAGASGVTVNGANVTKADIGASNGVIHVIDTVVLPPAK